MDIQKEMEQYEAVLKESGYSHRPLTKTAYGYANPITQFGFEIWFTTQKAAKAQVVPKWISVSDRMPPVDETVLVCWDHAPDVEPDKEYTTIDENLDEYWPNCQDEPPTHWMPIPKVIEAQEQSHDSESFK